MAGGTPRRYFEGLSRETFLLALASLFSDIATEMLYPILPIFLTETVKAGGGVVGLIEGLAQAVQNLVQGLSGSLSDRLRRRKPVALAGFLTAALAKPLIGIAPGWEGVLGARLLDRVGTGVRSAPRDALVAGSVAEADRGRAFGLEGAGDNLGAFIGPLLAILLLAILHVPMRVLFLLAVVPGLLAFAVVALVREERRAPVAAVKLDVPLSGFSGGYARYLLAVALFGLGNTGAVFLILQTKANGASLTVTVLIYAAYNLVAALASYPAGFLSDRFGRKRVLLVSFSVFALAYLGFAVLGNPALEAVLFALYGVHQGVFRSGGKALAADLTPARLRASGIGWYSAVVGLTGLAAGVAAGQLWDHVGHAAVFFYGAACAGLGALALLILVPGQRSKS